MTCSFSFLSVERFAIIPRINSRTFFADSEQKVCGCFHFRGLYTERRIAVCVYDEKMREVSKGGRSHPWHTILRKQSLVCYTFVPAGAKGVMPLDGQHLFYASSAGKDFRATARKFFARTEKEQGYIVPVLVSRFSAGRYQNHQGNSSQTLSIASSSVDFARLSER